MIVIVILINVLVVLINVLIVFLFFFLFVATMKRTCEGDDYGPSAAMGA
jgi:hypothetical protein